MEYAFAIAAMSSNGELVFEAPEYAEGHLDWYAFDFQPDASLVRLEAMRRELR